MIVEEYSALLVKETCMRCPPIIPAYQGVPLTERKKIRTRVASYKTSLIKLIGARDKGGIRELVEENEDLFVGAYNGVLSLIYLEMDFILRNKETSLV